MILEIIIDIEEKLGTPSPFRFTQVEEMGPLLTQFISIAISISAILLLIYLIFSGIQWLTSGGEKTAVAAARERMTAAFIGLVIVLSAWAIFTLVKYLFGIPPVPEAGPPASPTP